MEEIRGEIEETRADLSETIDAIQGKLSPDKLKEEAKTRVHEATLQAKDRLREVATAKAQDARTLATQKAQQARGLAIEKAQAVRPVVEERALHARATVAQKLQGSGTRSMERIEHNPKPFAMAGLGLVTLTGIGLLLRAVGRRRSG